MGLWHRDRFAGKLATCIYAETNAYPDWGLLVSTWLVARLPAWELDCGDGRLRHSMNSLDKMSPYPLSATLNTSITGAWFLIRIRHTPPSSVIVVVSPVIFPEHQSLTPTCSDRDMEKER